MIGIIGAGFGGLFLAWHLAERNLPCFVVGSTGNAASYAAQGIVGNKGLLLADTSLFQNKIIGSILIKEFCFDLERRSGKKLVFEEHVYEPFYSIKDWQKSQKRIYRESFYGCYGAELFTGEAIKSLAAFKKSARLPVAVLRYGFDAFIDVENLLSLMGRNLTERGVSFYDTEVLEVSNADKWMLLSRNPEPLSCDHLFLAPGNGFDFFRSQLDIDLPPSQIASGITCVIPGQDESSGHFAIVQQTNSLCRYPGKTVVGATSHKGGLKVVHQEEDVVHLTRKFSPFLQIDKEQIQIRAGERIYFKNREPVAGRFLSRRYKKPVWLLSGLYKNGLQLAPLLAKKMCEEFIAECSV